MARARALATAAPVEREQVSAGGRAAPRHRRDDAASLPRGAPKRGPDSARGSPLWKRARARSGPERDGLGAMLHKVILFRNGMVMAFDDIHAQVAELQRLAAEVRAKINQAPAGLAGVGFYLGRWEIGKVSSGCSSS